MAANDFKNAGNRSIRLLDGDTPANTLTLLGVEDGGVSFGAMRESATVYDGNVPVARTKAREKPTVITVNTTYKEWKSRTGAAADGSGSSIRDFMLGNYTDAVSVADGGDHEFQFEYTAGSNGATNDQDEVFLYDRCILLESTFQEDPEMNKVSFQIESLDTKPTVTRS